MKTLTLLLALACGLGAQDAPPQPTPAASQAPSPNRQESQKPASRIDQKRPYMRVWYWPPSPLSADFVDQAQADIPTGPSAQGQARSGGPRIDTVNFPTDRSAVVDEELELQRLASWMTHNPNARVALEGYADARGTKAHNVKLSKARAEAVKEYLVRHGASPSAIRVEARGNEHPLHGGNSEESHWLSRRVAVRVENPVAAVPSSAPAKPAMKPTAITAAAPVEKAGEAKKGTEN